VEFGVVENTTTPQGVEVCDLRVCPDEEASRLRDDFHRRMTIFLQENPSFGPQETCDQSICFAALNSAYIDHVEEEREAGREPQAYEEFSALHASDLLPDYVAYPHLGVHWFGLKAPNESEYDGALVITNIWRIRETEIDKDYFIGWPTVVAPNSMDFMQTWGDVCRHMMNTDLVVSADGLFVDFVEWSLPTSEESRYVDRGEGNSFGLDILRVMGDGLRVHFEDETLGKAPSIIKRELRPDDSEADYPVYSAGSEPSLLPGA